MFKKLLGFILLIPVIFVITGCGAIFYPERSGNTHKIDPKVAVADGVGLIFFIIPGVVAYAIDFSTGCIYLSGGSASKSSYNNLTKNCNPSTNSSNVKSCDNANSRSDNYQLST